MAGYDRDASHRRLKARMASAMNATPSEEVEDTLLASEMVCLEADEVVAAFPPAEREAARRGLYRDTDGVLRTRYPDA